MRTESERIAIITEHYKKWIEQAVNPKHKKYAESMYKAVLEGKHKEVFEELGVYRFVSDNGRYFVNVEEAASAYKTSPSNIEKNYLRYGLRRIKQ